MTEIRYPQDCVAFFGTHYVSEYLPRWGTTPKTFWACSDFLWDGDRWDSSAHIGRPHLVLLYPQWIFAKPVCIRQSNFAINSWTNIEVRRFWWCFMVHSFGIKQSKLNPIGEQNAHRLSPQRSNLTTNSQKEFAPLYYESDFIVLRRNNRHSPLHRRYVSRQLSSREITAKQLRTRLEVDMRWRSIIRPRSPPRIRNQTIHSCRWNWTSTRQLSQAWN